MTPAERRRTLATATRAVARGEARLAAIDAAHAARVAALERRRVEARGPVEAELAADRAVLENVRPFELRMAGLSELPPHLCCDGPTRCDALPLAGSLWCASHQPPQTPAPNGGRGTVEEQIAAGRKIVIVDGDAIKETA